MILGDVVGVGFDFSGWGLGFYFSGSKKSNHKPKCPAAHEKCPADHEKCLNLVRNVLM
jgi:hypothetical protein